MFQSFFNLREQPFDANPDPRFLYLSRTHREAFSSLLYRIQIDSGFLAMVAPPGMGKTMLLFHLLHRLQTTARTAFVFQTQCTSHELLQHLLSEFECDTSITDPVRMSQELKSFLIREANAGHRCVLIVDEAQNLRPEVLETIRLLSNFETPSRKLLQIVLSGQSELGDVLARPELRQLRQRMSCIIHIQRFSPEETALYINHRLAVAGYTGKLSNIFNVEALTRIAQLSYGVPRVVNNLCFNSLSLAFALEFDHVTLDVVDEVANDLGLSSTSSAFSKEDEIPSPATAILWDSALKSIEAACAKQELEVETRAVDTVLSSGKEPPSENGSSVGAPALTVNSAKSTTQSDRPELIEDGPLEPESIERGAAPVESTLDAVHSPSAEASPEEDPADDVALAPVAMLDANSQSSPLASFAGTARDLERPAPKTDVVVTLPAGIRLRIRNIFRKLDGQFVARICACVLVLSLTPALDAPAPHTVSAQKIAGPSASLDGGETTVSAAEISTANNDSTSASSDALPIAAQRADGQTQLEKIWKTELHATGTRNFMASPHSSHMIDLLPLAPTPVQPHLIASSLPLAPQPSGTRTPIGRPVNSNTIHSTSDALWPATCRQERYATLYSLMGITHQGQIQPTAVCSFFAAPASELSTK